jgi:predicted dienelactone hydrolase
MRPLETLILALSVVWFVLPALTRRRGIRQGVGLLVAMAVPWQLAIEGYRWQMVPAYAVVAVIGLATWWEFIGPSEDFSIPQRGRGVGRALGGLVGVAALALPIVLPVPRLPQPAGAFEVGTFSLHLVDESRMEVLGARPGGPRELMVQVFYPGEPATDAETAPWIEDLPAVGAALADLVDAPSFSFDHLALTDTHSYPDAPVSDSIVAFPVVVYSHGWRSFRTANINQAETLASDGYVVVTIDHTYASAMTVFPGGREAPADLNALPDEDEIGETAFLAAGNRLIETMAADLEFVIDELEAINRGRRSTPLAQRLDINRLGLFGHSLGGGAVVTFCATDSRCKAGMGFDPWVEPIRPEIIEQGLTVPFAFVRSEEWVGNDNDKVLRRLFENGGRNQYWQSITGTEHRDFVFAPLMSPVGGLIGIQGSIDSRRLIDILDEGLIDFFGQHLLGEDREFPGGMQAEYGEFAAP